MNLILSNLDKSFSRNSNQAPFACSLTFLSLDNLFFSEKKKRENNKESELSICIAMSQGKKLMVM